MLSSPLRNGDEEGVGRFFIPKEFGIVLEKKNAFEVLETHFDNAKNDGNKVDVSGVWIYYTNTKRKHVLCIWKDH